MSHAIVDSALPTRHYIYLSLFQFNLSVLVSFYSYRLTWRNKVDSRNSTCARLEQGPDPLFRWTVGL